MTKELTDEELNIAICEWRGCTFWLKLRDIYEGMVCPIWNGGTPFGQTAPAEYWRQIPWQEAVGKKFCNRLPNHVVGIEALGHMHEAENVLREKQHAYDVFIDWLVKVASPNHDRLGKEYSDEDIRHAVFATARQRAIALLHLINPEPFKP